jgi:hypothetical protein
MKSASRRIFDARSPALLVVWGHAIMAVALWASNGRDSALALGAIIVSLVAWQRALHLLMQGVSAGVESAELGTWVLALILTVFAFLRPPAMYLHVGVLPFQLMNAAVLVLLGTYALDILGLREVHPRLVLARRAALFALALVVGGWILRASPDPQIDLFPLHQQAAEVMLAGKSIYEPGAIHTLETFRHQGWVDEYTYLPFGACLTTIAYAFTHESRWADLAAQLVGGALLWLAARRCSRSPVWADLVAALLLFHPRGPFVLEQAWIEPLALPFLGGFVVLALARRPIPASVCLGLLVAVKQHLVIYVPFLAMIPGIGFSGAVVAGLVTLATIAPFALRTPYGFYRGTLGQHVHNPFRDDSLSIPAVVAAATGLIAPAWVGFVAGLVPLAWLRRFPRRVAPLLLASCLSFGLFYVLGRQALCNYYYLLDATVLFAAATLGE